jgi:flagellar basal-body rod protein FlgB
VNTISDSAIIAALGRQMNRAVTRETVAASNLANLDTPGYKAKTVKFAETLEAQLTAAAKSAVAPIADDSDQPVVEEATDLLAKRDGNTVQLDKELYSMNHAAADFSAAQTALSAKFRLVRYAINEGR